MADWRERLGVVFSTNPDYEYDNGAEEQPETLAPAEQKLRVWRDTHGRAGKVATIVRGFVGCDDDLDTLGRELKRKIGVGGSVKDGEIIIQGEHRQRVAQILVEMGYSKTKSV